MSSPAVVGLARAKTESRPDPRDPKLAVVDLEFLTRFDPPVTLREIKDSNLFDDWALIRQSRLSTMPAPPAFAVWMRKRFPKASI
jgi:predicted RNA-binding protein with PUA-like domain